MESIGENSLLQNLILPYNQIVVPTNLRHHGRVVNCKGLQSSKVIGSNPIGASILQYNRSTFLA